MKESSLYIHVPYCTSKCIYCDFFSGGAAMADWKVFVDALLNEFASRIGELSVVPDTLYIGGGTPSLMPEREFSRLISSINQTLDKTNSWLEFTIEVNPDDVSDYKCKTWKDAGVTRVSMGIQSLNDNELTALKRRHNSKGAIAAYRLLRKYFNNVSVDLMFGIPGQTLDSWHETIETVIDMRPEHLSAYSLMLEEGTALTMLYNQGRVELPDDEICDAMWEMLSDRFRSAGYVQYEISNYSLPGYRSIHNSRYWSGNPYLGLGPSAHSYNGSNIRRFNPSDLKGYLSHFTSADDTKSGNINDIRIFYNEEILTEGERIEERILTRLRVKEGIDLKEFRNEFGERHYQRLLDNAAPMISSGEIAVDSDHLFLTKSGIMTSNRIILNLCL